MQAGSAARRIAITLVLALSAFQYVAGENLPKIPYLTWGDKFTLISFVYISLVMVYCSYTTYIATQGGGYDDGEYDNAGNEPEPALETRQQQQQQQQQQLAEGAAQLPTAATTYATTTPAVPTRAGRPSLSFKTIGRSLSFSRGRTERAKHKTKAQDVHSSASGSGAAPR